MRSTIYDGAGTQLASYNSNAQASATYDRMDVGILSLQQTYSAMDVYDFRVPGDPYKVTFQYKFPRAGFLLGVSFTGTVSTTISAGIYAQRTNISTGAQSDVMVPSDTGNTQTYDQTNFPKYGMLIMAPNPIAYNQGDLANMKFKSFYNGTVAVNLAGFLIIGLNPQ